MKKEEFRAFIEKSIEDVIRHAEYMTGMKLPRTIAFQWLGRDSPIVRKDIVEEILGRVFVTEEEIYPCVDLGPSEVLDGTLLLQANIAGYSPRPFQKNWTGSDGPFVPSVFGPLASKVLPQRRRRT
jgi:hypothetical protein